MFSPTAVPGPVMGLPAPPVEFRMPWEHFVCSVCHQENPFAIWLTKQHCFEPHKPWHQRADRTLVVVDTECMKMVEIRPFPPKGFTSFRGRFYKCRYISNCRWGPACNYAHSDAELDTWNTKKRILTVNSNLVAEIEAECLPCQSPSRVCQSCMRLYHTDAPWLAWLHCIHPEEHARCAQVTVIISSRNTLVRVRDLPDGISYLKQIRRCRNGPEDCQCNFAHSNEELYYWKWEFLKTLCKSLDRDFSQICFDYGYPLESRVEEGVKGRSLTPKNYKSQYHRLVYLDEMEHSRKMIKECDCLVDVEVSYEGPHVHLSGISSGAIDYAIHGHASVELIFRGQKYLATIAYRDIRRDTLVVEIHSTKFFQYFGGRVLERVPAHFEINHRYFQRQQQAIELAGEPILQKLVPPKELLKRVRSKRVDLHEGNTRNFALDEEYQAIALRRMLSATSRVPYLVLGPFGTGKTHVLAAAVAKLVENPDNKVLVCTHLNKGADSLYRNLQKHVPRAPRKALRLVPNPGAMRQLVLFEGASCTTVRELDADYISGWPVIVTTFLTALNIKDILNRAGTTLDFTHILIDEGAQSRESEVLGALVLAGKHTKVIIVGDNQQVGPQVAVLSDAARENGLGTSLIERLFTHYKENKGTATDLGIPHTAALLTNYRCHPSILMLASSLLYECTLLSRSDSKPHPKAPFPIIFACTSLEQEGFRNLPDENVNEAELLVQKMLEFVRSWPHEKGKEKPRIGLLAPTRQQVGYLRRRFRELERNPERLPCEVEIMPTYIIQGEEFTAVFLSTCEPTDNDGNSQDPVRSICNEYIFNTLITRARSLVFSAGNPFLLCQMGLHYNINCWAEYIHRCIQCQTLLLPNPKPNSESEIQQLPQVVEKLHKQVMPAKSLDQAAQLDLEPDTVDTIVQQYISNLHARKEFKRAHRLVQDPKGQLSWEATSEEDVHKRSRGRKRVIEWCRIDCKSYHTAVAVPTDSSKPSIKLDSQTSRRLAFHGDVVPVDTIHKCVLLDDNTARAISQTHFGASFLCRVDLRNPIQFLPLDNRYPKFANLPTLTHKEREGVVCFDPKSINSSPKMSNFIPMECAMNMLFVVKFLGWREQFPYPLGIVVGALPPAYSASTGDVTLRLSHSIPLAPSTPVSDFQESLSETPSQIFQDAFTIDPEGSPDHDDALTCSLVTKDDVEEIYEIGVHITNVHKYVPKSSEVDRYARQRGCSVYRAPDNCISPMLPEELVRATGLLVGKPRDAFSVIFRAVIKNGIVQKVDVVRITESQVTSALELTYKEAQTILCRESYKIRLKLLQYKRSRPGQSSELSVQTKLQVVWKVAFHMRTLRLGKAASCFRLDEPEEEYHPQAHYLVEEFMIATNQQVAKRLLKTFPAATILRTQAEPNKEKLQSLVSKHGPAMAASLALRAYTPQGQPVCSPIHILQSTALCIQNELQKGNIQQALNLIQFEHLHPQLAVAHSLFRHTCSPSQYLTAKSQKAQEEGTWHDTLQCGQYTHFTSPIRRYIDIVIQRLLHAALNNRKCPHPRQELDEICVEGKAAAKRANDYELGMKRLVLASKLQQGGLKELCFVTEVEEGKVYLCFRDPTLKKLLHPTSILLRCVNASRLQRDETPKKALAAAPTQSTASAKAKSSKPKQHVPVPVFSWRVKMASFLGSPEGLLSHPHLEVCASEVSEAARADISLFVPVESEDAQQTLHLIERKLQAQIKSFTSSLPSSLWNEFQACLHKDPRSIDATALLQKLQLVCTSHIPRAKPPHIVRSSEYPLWIYSVSRPVQSGEVMHVHLSAHHQTSGLVPTIQLLEVGPGLRICIQHNNNRAQCFTDKLRENASKKDYTSIEEYFQKWEPIILAEAAFNSLTESELLLVKDATLAWPRLEMHTDSTGQVYYRLPMPVRNLEDCIHMHIPEKFLQSSYDFFKFSSGDLVCVRYENTKEEPAKYYVFHMVVHFVKEEFKKADGRQKLVKATVHLKFVSHSSNYISHTMGKLLRSHHRNLLCEVQLIPLTLPYRRVYRSLCQLKSRNSETTKLAEDVALGRAQLEHQNPPSLSKILSPEKASIATSLWPLHEQQLRPGGQGKTTLNNFQKKAIKLACVNKFTMIQGPPGTGKSVTGAHLAYALAMKLKEEKRCRQASATQSPHPCVMYCGPTQQSVNVVLNMLVSDNPDKESLTILRVYSKAIERKDFPGPKFHNEIFPQVRTDAKCTPQFQKYALHHIIREGGNQIIRMERQFQQLHKEGKIPSCEMRSKYKSLIKKAEAIALTRGVDIVLCTCNEASSHRVMDNLQPVYCIIDECAMATEPECMVPIRRAEHVVLIGDHQQLQPVIQNRDAKENGLGRSLFERYVEKVGVQPFMLQVQYRMHPDLCKFPSEEFYDGKLTTDPAVMRRRKEEAARLHSFWPHDRREVRPFVFCDVIGDEFGTPTGIKDTAQVGHESKFNVKEANKVVYIARKLIDSHKVDPKEIAILTPYSAQKEEIKRQMERQRLVGVEVKTITDSQGSEYGIVLLSTVRSKPLRDITARQGERKKADIGWLRANLGFITDRHQICVGITRCKYGLVIVGNKMLLGYDPTWCQLIEHYEEHGCVRDGRHFPS